MEAGTLSRPAPAAAGTAGVAAARSAGWTAALALALVTALGAALRLVAFDRVRVNPFYDAAVRSMGQSWHNLFYGAFEPAGQVSIDKMPADLWLQVASTRLLGFTPVALRLPEVIAGILAIPLLYDVIRRLFGRRAGLLSAATLAVLPVSVVTARSDTMDSLMMLCVLAAAWLVVRAGHTARTVPLVAAGAVMGLAFNVKLFEGLIALPALLVLAVLVADTPRRRQAGQLAAAAAAFVVVSLSWLVAVSLGPAAKRPFPIGSTGGSVWDAVFRFNGVDRINTPPSAAQALLDPPGITRLFTTGGVMYGRLIGSALIVALVLGAAVIAALAWQRVRGSAPDPLTADEARRHRAGAWFIVVWLILGVALFSTVGILRPRYLEAFTPAVAGCVGVSLVRLGARARRDPVARWLLALGVAVTATLAGRVAVLTWPAAGAIALGAAAIAVLAAAGLSRLPRAAGAALLAAATVAVLAVPAAGSAHLALGGASDAGRAGAAPPARVAALSRYLRAHQGAARYEAASTTVAKAGPLIVRDGRPVLMLTSLHGRPLLTPSGLAAVVARADVRYVLLGRGRCAPRRPRCAPVLRWARRHATDVSRAAGQRAGVLYRLRVRAVRTSTAHRTGSQTSTIDTLMSVAERRYALEHHGRAVRELLRRVAADPVLRASARSGSTHGLRAAVASRYDRAWRHWHVSRVRIVRGRHVLADAGVPFVVAPSSRPLRDARGRTLATLQVSEQDVIGFVRFMHRNHGVEVVVRGAGPDHVRSSLRAAAHAVLPDRGRVTIAGRSYRVRAFEQIALGGEPLKIWILLRA